MKLGVPVACQDYDSKMKQLEKSYIFALLEVKAVAYELQATTLILLNYSTLSIVASLITLTGTSFAVVSDASTQLEFFNS
jgi:hypothetical protein